MIRYSGNPKIRRAQHRNDREVLAYIKWKMREQTRASFTRGSYCPAMFIISVPWRNALDRLIEKGLVRYDRKNYAYVATARGMRSR